MESDAIFGLRIGDCGLREGVAAEAATSIMGAFHRRSEKTGERGKGRIWLAGANQSYVVRSAHGLMARTCAGKGPLQAVALYFRLVPVFPALREYASPHERARLFPAVRVERRNRSEGG